MSSSDDCRQSISTKKLVRVKTVSEKPKKFSLCQVAEANRRDVPKSVWFFGTILPSILSSSLCRYIHSSPLVSVFIFPAVRFTMDSILQGEPLLKVQSALAAIYKFVLPSSEPTSPAESGCAGLLRDLVLAQERTMFYTVTLNPSSPPTPNQGIPKKISPNLKWQCASALSRSQSVLQRTNNNSMQYYTFTYLGELDVTSVPDLHPKQKDFSPVRIYINS